MATRSRPRLIAARVTDRATDTPDSTCENPDDSNIVYKHTPRLKHTLCLTSSLPSGAPIAPVPRPDSPVSPANPTTTVTTRKNTHQAISTRIQVIIHPSILLSDLPSQARHAHRTHHRQAQEASLTRPFGLLRFRNRSGLRLVVWLPHP